MGSIRRKKCALIIADNRGNELKPTTMADNHQHPSGQDTEDWLNLLAGRTVPNADSRTRQEVEALRQGILAQPVPTPHELSAAELAQGRERLLFALRRATPHRPWWQRPALLSGLAAGLIGIAFLPLLTFHHPPLTDTSDSSPPSPRVKSLRMPTVVRVAQPAVTARALAADLSAANITAQATPQGKSWFIDARLPRPLPPELAAVLARHGLKPPPDARLLVEFAPQAPQ